MLCPSTHSCHGWEDLECPQDEVKQGISAFGSLPASPSPHSEQGNAPESVPEGKSGLLPPTNHPQHGGIEPAVTPGTWELLQSIPPAEIQNSKHCPAPTPLPGKTTVDNLLLILLLWEEF